MDYEYIDDTPIIVDNGSGSVKAGYAGDDAPLHVLPSLVGRLPRDGVTIDTGVKDLYIGHEAQKRRDTLDITYPIERGNFTDWDAMEQIWHHIIYNKMRASPESHPILLTDTALNPRANRERMAQVMFESFKVSNFHVTGQEPVSIYGAGRSTGIVFSSGHGATNAVPIYNGIPLRHAITHINFAGRDLTDYLMKLLRERDPSLDTSLIHEAVQNVKEEHCYIAPDFSKELQTIPEEKPYSLPDGQVINIHDEGFRAAEALFQPSLAGIDANGIHRVILKSITACDIDIHSDLYRNIILCGGNTMVVDINNRLKSEICALTPSDTKVVVHATPERKDLTWIGASVISSLGTFRDNWITRQEYDECGPIVVHRKCY